MNAFLKIVSSAALFCALLLLPLTASAASAKSAAAYSLKLSLSKDWNANPSGISVVTDFANSGSYTLLFSFYANPLSFQVEYQPAEDEAATGKGWVTLVPYPPPSNGRPVKMLTRDIVGTMRPGERWSETTTLTGFSTSAEGLYRITARVQFPEASQFKGSATDPGNYRKFLINLYSNPVVIRRTKTGLVEVGLAIEK